MDHVDGRLGHEVDGAESQRIEGDVGTQLRQRGAHDHRDRPQAHQIGEERETVHARHLDIQCQDIGVERLDLVARDERVGR